MLLLQVPVVQPNHLMSNNNNNSGSNNGADFDPVTATTAMDGSTSTTASVVASSATKRAGGVMGSASGSRSVSLASVSSDGSSSESHLVEQEDIVALTQEVRAFKEALGKLRRLFHPNDKGKQLYTYIS